MRISIQSGPIPNDVGSCEEAYRLIAEAGFEAIDWNIDMLLPCENIYGKNWRGISILEKSVPEILEYLEPELQAIRKSGLAIAQAHAPFPAHSARQPGHALLDFMIGIYQNCIRVCQAVGCPILVIHGITHQAGDIWNTAEELEAQNEKLFTSLIPTLRETDVTVCMENLFSHKEMLRGKAFCEGHCANPDRAAAFIDHLNGLAGKECFGLCLDTGHLHLLRGDFRLYIKTLAHRIKALHIHDNDGCDDQHIAPYNGTVYWKNFYESLRAIGYRGDLNFETFRQTSIQNIEKELLPSQLAAICAIGRLFRKRILESFPA